MTLRYRQPVALVAGGPRYGKHTLTGLFANIGAARQRPRRGALRHPGKPRDIDNRRWPSLRPNSFLPAAIQLIGPGTLPTNRGARNGAVET